MMATLTIRDVPDELNLALIRAAEKNRRSKEKHALFLIEGGVMGRKPLKQTLTEAAALRAQCKRTVSMTEILQFTEAAH